MQLFAHEGITAGIRRAFVVYLASHNRPVHEVLFPSLRDIRQEYEHNFEGMTVEPVELEDAAGGARADGARTPAGSDADERRFLLSLVAAEPEWSLLGVPHLEQLPGLRWKLQNLERLAEGRCPKVRRAIGHAGSAIRMSTRMAGERDMDVTADWYWEGNVVEAIARFLAQDGWTIVGKADTHSKERGVDIQASERRQDAPSRSQGLSVKELPRPAPLRGG